MNPRERRAARRQPSAGASPVRPRRSAAMSVALIVDTALNLVAEEGFDALTMRRLATALDTGPASLYAHVVDKHDLDELLIGRLCAGLTLPEPDAARWQEQLREVCAGLRDGYLAYPGISRAAYAMAPTDVQILRVGEGMLGILLAGGVAPQAAAWASDALLLYVAAYCLEIAATDRRALVDDADWVRGADDLRQRLAALPADDFPHTRRHATELTSGQGHDRFDFTIELMIGGLVGR